MSKRPPVRLPLRWALVACCLALLATLMPPHSTHAQEPVSALTKVRVGYEKERVRLVLDLERDVGYRWFTLPSPARLVVDFPQIDIQQSFTDLELPPGAIITAARAGNFRPGTTRLVFDLSKPARISIFGIPGNTQRGPRLVIDVVPPQKGQKPTDVPPPPDVVTQPTPNQARQDATEIAVGAVQKEAPIVPRQVVTKPSGPITIVLDAGHGGVDPGASGDRIHEKDLTLMMVKKVKDRLEDKGYIVKLSRDKDVYVPLADRVTFAQKNNANLFVSFHADSLPHRTSDVRGATVYMVSEKASDREAQRLANSENEGDILAGVDLSHETREVQNILMSLVQRDTMNHSSYLAQSVLGEMKDVTSVRKSDPMFAGFRVLKAPDVPSILVEMGYLSNPEEEANLANEGFRNSLADALAKGIESYVKNRLR